MRKVSLILLGILVIAGFAEVFFWAREPVYEGKALNHWVEVLGTPNSSDIEVAHASHAIDTIGPASLPFLERWLRFEDRPWRRRTGSWLREHGWYSIADFVERWRKERLAEGSCLAVRVLGTRALPLLPGLIRMAGDTRRTQTARRALHTISGLRTTGLEKLIEIVSGPYATFPKNGFAGEEKVSNASGVISNRVVKAAADGGSTSLDAR